MFARINAMGATNPSITYIAGLAHSYPQYSFGPKEFEDYVARLYPKPDRRLQKLIRVNRITQIRSRRTIFDLPASTANVTPLAIDELSQIFRKEGIDLAVSACTKAMEEAGLRSGDITHVVAVTCTDQSNPGYDLFVCRRLKLQPDVQRTLLHGVGCAGGLSALRAAVNIAAAEIQKGRPARVLVMATELCSLFLNAELHVASQDDSLHIASALFSDAAAAVVVCNGLALRKSSRPIFEVQGCGSMLVPNTTEYMSYDVTSNGVSTIFTKDFGVTLT
jgi:type III polyketide synthase